jgi:hypothetical protein
MASDIDPLKAYAEFCNTARYYSDASLKVRAMTVVQGVGLIGVWAVGLEQHSYIVICIFPIIGILFTMILQIYHKGYYKTAFFFYQSAGQIEEKYFDGGWRPCAALGRYYAATDTSLKSRFLTDNAPFTLIGTMFGLALVASIIAVVCRL